MDVGSILLSALTGAAALAVCGAVGGGITGLVSEKKKQTQMEAVQLALPEEVAAVPEFASAFLVFAKEPAAKEEVLQKVYRRCSAMLQLYQRIAAAEPTSVHLRLIPEGRKVHTDFLKHLRDFYIKSGVRCVRVGESVVPIRAALTDAHKALVGTMDVLMFNLTDLVTRKSEQGVAIATTNKRRSP